MLLERLFKLAIFSRFDMILGKLLENPPTKNLHIY